MKQQILGLTLLCLVFFFGAAQEARAQVGGYNFGIGAQLGDPSGLSLKWYRGGGPGSLNFQAYDFLFAWDTGPDDYNAFFVNVHGLFERPITDVPLNFYYGPGIFVGFYESAGDDGVTAGISGNFGVSFVIDRFDIFFQLTPRLALAPDTNGDLGGGIGARFYL